MKSKKSNGCARRKQHFGAPKEDGTNFDFYSKNLNWLKKIENEKHKQKYMAFLSEREGIFHHLNKRPKMRLDGEISENQNRENSNSKESKKQRWEKDRKPPKPHVGPISG